MRWQTTAVLAVILIALGVFYYVYEVRLGPEREKTEGRKGRVFTVEPADVAEVELKRADSTVKLQREAGKPAVFVVGDSVLRDTTRPVAEFRDKTVLAFEQKDVTGVALDLRDEKIALEQADGRWKLTRPRVLPADADTVRDFLDKLR